ncbi:MAG: hydroxymethylglutaryl-CoA reductase, degradative [Bacteroidetes bacterium]|nr:hydroxymethylglutaryl-CoA reductase, degradative [Bacteroidota bacterium]MBU1580526.1 hydroxymethylglutaryl-CoA reductase, degradative [Bacteroidota bacterium]MBU2466555.1 hydroxymethylglutaryl-CoA reductase, degradative [Bacteroidota bacterium]MBU2557132.1 hydroxymethylglutaryl-CoA reductase, degradative [Bacteroidota bacterium]
MIRKRDIIIKGFSKLLKEEKLKLVAEYFENPGEVVSLLKSFWHTDEHQQKLFDEFSENTITNFYIPYGISPNVIINGRNYLVPMVIEESSVVAAASAAAKFWSQRGGFHAEVVDIQKIGQVHFSWSGKPAVLQALMPAIKKYLIDAAKPITTNMEKRGGGILDIQLVNMTEKLEDYYQLLVTFDTQDSMGANFINSVLEEFGNSLRTFMAEQLQLSLDERQVEIIMAILSNYTPSCLVKTWVECTIDELENVDENLTGAAFAKKFEKAVKIAQIDTYRATTHNKGIYNGIDAVAIATGNDFRAIEAAGHTYAARNGHYESLSRVEVKDNKFRFILEAPLAIGTVGGLTNLHPLAKQSLQLLGNPSAKELMMVAAVMGLANNFSAVKSLTTTGIQAGHMKMHLFNILNHFKASEEEKSAAVAYFKDQKVSFASVGKYIASMRS